MNETALKPGFLSRSVGPLHINLDRQLYGESHVQSFMHSEVNRRLSVFNQKLFDGDVVNPTENRPASHWALRSMSRVR